MLRKYMKATISVVITVFLLVSIVSCEEDFTDIGTSIVNNGEFSTNDTVFEIEVTGKNIENVQADGFQIGGILGQYLLGVYNNSNYKKIEASIISQLAIPSDLTLVDNTFGSDTTVVTTIDTVLLRIPYNASLLTTAVVNSDYIFEPSKLEIVEALIPKSLKTQLYKALRDSFASEHGARMTAMHKATDNATELRDELLLTYNKARQAAITNEILEIVGGAEALNG